MIGIQSRINHPSAPRRNPILIEAELDDLHAERLHTLQERLQKPMSEVLAAAIDAAWALPPDKDEPSPLYRAFEKAGLIGCIEADENLSTDYKRRLDFSHKCG